jgi:hypothetical protein
LLKAQHAHHLAIDADTGVEHGVDIQGAQAFGQFAGARVASGVLPASIERLVCRASR